MKPLSLLLLLLLSVGCRSKPAEILVKHAEIRTKRTPWWMTRLDTSPPRIAVTFRKSGALSIYAGTSTGSLRLEETIQLQPGLRAAEAPDLDGDGQQELAVISARRQLIILHRKGGRFEQKQTLTLEDIPSRLTTGRFLRADRDAIAVLTGSSPARQSVTLFSLEKEGLISKQKIKASGARSLTAFSRSGKTQALAVIKSGAFSIHDGARVIAKGTVCKDAYAGIAFAKRKGGPEHLAIACVSGALEIINTPLSNATTERFTVGKGAYDVRAADLDQDGIADLGTADLRARTLSIFFSSSGAKTPKTYPTSPGPGAWLDIDLDSDGDRDVVIMAIEGHRLEVFKNIGAKP